MARRVSVAYAGVIATRSGKRQEWVDLDDGAATVEALLASLGYGAEHRRFLKVEVDGRKADLETPIPDGAAVSVFLPLGGG